MILTLSNPIVKHKKQRVRFTVDSFRASVRTLFKEDKKGLNIAELRVTYKSLTGKHKPVKLAQINFEVKTHCKGKFNEIAVTKEKGALFQVKHNHSQELDIVLTTRIFGYLHTIKITSDKLKSYKIVVEAKIVRTYTTEGETGNQFVSYVNFLDSWWPPEAIAAGLGVPTYSHPYAYNTINLAFWTTNQGPVDAALLWANALTYVSVDNPWGSTTQEIQEAWLKLYHDYGVKVLVSAFGSTDFPTSQGTDPITVAEALAKFVIDNNLDGVDLDWEDNAAMENSTGEPWLVTCTKKLRELLPRPYIISHAPQAPYFMGTSKYPAGGYLKVNQDAGADIDFYNIQFYNQDSSKYDTYNTLYNVSDGWAIDTAVKQIAANGVEPQKLVVGKGVIPADFFNTGYVPVDDLAAYLKQGVTEGYHAGFMGWQFSSDKTGEWSEKLAASFN